MSLIEPLQHDSHRTVHLEGAGVVGRPSCDCSECMENWQDPDDMLVTLKGQLLDPAVSYNCVLAGDQCDIFADTLVARGFRKVYQGCNGGHGNMIHTYVKDADNL